MAQRIITFTSGAKILSEAAPARIIQTGSTLAVFGASVTSVNGETGAVILDAADVGAEADLGVPATTGYVLTSTTGGVRSWVPQTGGGGGAVDSVNGHTGVVVLTTTDIGAVPLGDPALTNARTPTAHASTHGTTGADAVSPASIGAEVSGAASSAIAGHNLAYDHTHIATAYSHAGTTGNPHNTTAADVGALVTTDLTSHTSLTTGAHGGLVASNDSRLTDSRTPTAHASTHGTTGTDAIAPSSIGASKALTVTALKTGNYSANASEYVPCDISAGSFAITLPTAPADKTVIQILIVKTGATSYLTINAGGTDKFDRTDGPQSIYMYLAIESLVCQYQSSTGLWFLQSAAGTFNFATGNPGIDAMNPLSATEISIDTTTRVLTITPTRGYLDFFVDGAGKISRIRKTGPIAFPAFTDTSGTWFFYFDSSGTAITTQTPWTVSEFPTIATVYRIVWNSSLTGAAKLVSQYVEYHTNSITYDDHAWQHLQGAVWASGYTLEHNAITSGSPNADGRNSVIGLTSGTVRDENLPYTIENSTGGSIWQQDLGNTTPASLNATNSGQFKVFIQDSSSRISFLAASRWPFSFSAGSVPEYITATGVRTPVTNTDFFVYFVYSTQNPVSGEAVKVISATAEFTTIVNARAFTWADIQAAYSIIGNDNEIRPLYRLIFEHRTSYNVGAKYAALREVLDIRKAAVATVSVAAGSVPASSVTFVPAGGIGSTNVQAALEELDTEKAALAHASRHQNGGADEVATATAAANAIPKAGAGGTLATGWIPDLSATYATSAKGVTNGDSHDHNGGDGAAIVEAAITLADNATNNVSATKHGFFPKLPSVSDAKYYGIKDGAVAEIPAASGLAAGTESGTKSTATHGATASNTGAIAIGDEATTGGAVASAAGAIAIGTKGIVAAIASGADSISIGTGAEATTTNSIAIGKNADSKASSGNCIAIGDATSAAGQNSMALGSNTTVSASGIGGVALGYLAEIVSASPYGIALGAYSKTSRYGELSISGDHATANKNPFGIVQWKGQTTDGNAAEIYLHGVSSNRCTIVANSAIRFTLNIIAKQSATANVASWFVEGIILRDGSNNTTCVLDTGSPVAKATNGTVSGWTVAVTADDTNEALKIAVTGATSTTINWHVTAELTEVKD